MKKKFGVLLESPKNCPFRINRENGVTFINCYKIINRSECLKTNNPCPEDSFPSDCPLENVEEP